MKQNEACLFPDKEWNLLVLDHSGCNKRSTNLLKAEHHNVYFITSIIPYSPFPPSSISISNNSPSPSGLEGHHNKN